MAGKKTVDGDDIRSFQTDAVLNARFQEEKKKVTKVVKDYQSEWHDAMMVFMSNLECKTAERIENSVGLADAYIEVLKKKFK